ncbi:MAG TPA: response regulator transcription factor [Pseudonocardiaceae bacterium]|jgi:DNA-binding NarL/FixJ family response regulator|nr:response regulator transcription factor [Pseudonocardiaceae bacterium]
MTVPDLPAEPPAATVLIVDDQDIVATSLTYILRGNGFNAHRVPVIDLDTVRATAARYEPGVVLLDLDLGPAPDGGTLDGVELIAPLCAHGWTILVVTGTDDLDRIAAAVAHGASNWVMKSADFQKLVNAAIDAANGQHTMPAGERAALVARHRNNEAGRQLLAARLRLLTRREKAVLDALASGLTPAAMAAESHNSTATIRNQIHSILTKLEVNSQVEAIAIAHRHLRPMPASRA